MYTGDVLTLLKSSYQRRMPYVSIRISPRHTRQLKFFSALGLCYVYRTTSTHFWIILSYTFFKATVAQILFVSTLRHKVTFSHYALTRFTAFTPNMLAILSNGYGIELTTTALTHKRGGVLAAIIS